MHGFVKWDWIDGSSLLRGIVNREAMKRYMAGLLFHCGCFSEQLDDIGMA